MPNIEGLFRFSMPLLKKSEISIERLRKKDLLLFDVMSGSHAYGTNTPQSDEDYRGVFVMPSSFHAGMETLEQVSDEKEDLQFFELTRFIQLLYKNNPTALELIYTPEDCIRYKHPAFDLIPRELFLSKLCEQSFAGYALAQIKKARGLNKKIVNPQPECRKHLSEFCYILEKQGSILLSEWLDHENISAEDCGLVAVNHAVGTYAVFHDKTQTYRGLFSKKDDTSLLYSSVPIDAQPVAWMTCNLDAFKQHCKSHREYWNWVSMRNEDRYMTNSEHGRGYDSKNMMHTLRLLDMAIEIAEEKTIHVRRPNAEWLLRVKSGEFEYESLLSMAESKLKTVKESFKCSDLPNNINFDFANELISEVRKSFNS